jgi:signal transduction histidine kinase
MPDSDGQRTTPAIPVAYSESVKREGRAVPRRYAWLGEGAPLPTAVFLAALAAFQVIGTHFAHADQPDRHAPDAIAIVLLIAGPLALFARRRHPVGVLLFVLATVETYLALGYAYGPIFFSLVIAIYTAVVEGHRRAAWLAAGGLLAGHVALEYLVGRGSPLTLSESIGVISWTLVVLVVSEVGRVRRERRIEATRALEEEARRRASDERLRIARELHDVLAHNISLINVQAGVALHLIDEQPEQARTALAAIKEASKDVLREVRSTLGVLRQVDEEAPRFPSPSLGRLDDLVASAGRTGLTVRTSTTGVPRPIPASVDSAAFRIIQEALTNVSRHAGAATATVGVGYGPRDITVEISDDGTVAQDGSRKRAQGGTAERTKGGHGILGMRERATALGGQLDAGPRPGGGWRVRARLPLEGDG